MALDVVFLTPRDGLVAIAGIVPLVALALARRRAVRVTRRLGLPPAPRRGDALAVVAIVAIAALLGLAAAQPALDHATARRVRSDAEALFVFDISRSMQASPSRGAQTRLQQARRSALAVRDRIDDVPSGVASMTDRTLPLLFPSDDDLVFTAVVTRSLQADSPPPRQGNVVATTFNALRGVANGNFFSTETRKRVVILLTDGESRPFDVDAVAAAYRRPPGIGLVVWPIGGSGDRFWSADGTPEPGYRPLRSAPARVDDLGRAGAQIVHDAGAAGAAAKRILGSGPETRAGTTTGRTALTPYAVVAALIPLAGLLLLRARR